MPKKPQPIHSGVIALEEFLQYISTGQCRLANDINVPARRINEIVQGKRSITADMALRILRCFGKTAQFWMNFQTRFALGLEEDRLGSRLEDEAQHA